MNIKISKTSLALPLGIIVITFAVIGVYSIINWMFIGISNKNNDDQNEIKQKYAEFIAPLVMFDPPPFENLEAAPNDYLLMASVWAALSDEKSVVSDEGHGFIILPKDDVVRNSHILFGEKVSLVFTTFYSRGVCFEFLEESSEFSIPITSHVGLFSPVVEDYSKKGDTVTLTVGYISSVSVDFETPTKYMIYTITEIDEIMVITSVKQKS